MQIGWVDFTADERGKVLDLIQTLGEPTSLDELGVGILRDAISDKLYPGLSTLQGRAKYFVLVPYLFALAERQARAGRLNNGPMAARWIDEQQDKLVSTLLDNSGSDKARIIGKQDKKHPVKIKPARIYWNGLRVTGILRGGLSYAEACAAVVRRAEAGQSIRLAQESEEYGADDADAAQEGRLLFAAPPCPPDLMKNAAIQLTPAEATFLKEQFTTAPGCRDSLLAYRLLHGTAAPDFAAIDTADMPAYLKTTIELAKEFSGFLYGSQIIYNLVFAEGSTHADAEKWAAAYDTWRKTGQTTLPHLPELLALVAGHAPYKANLARFLREMEALAAQNQPTATGIYRCSEAEKACVIQRELQVKGRDHAKLRRPDHYPYAEVMPNPLAFRHGTATQIIKDIFEGLGGAQDGTIAL